MADACKAITAAAAADLLEDDEPVELDLSPGLSTGEIEQLAATHGGLPDALRAVLSVAAGFDGPVEVDFTGESMAFGLDELFDRPLPIATDGFGNHWVLELDDGRVWFVGHDPPVLVLQSCDLDHFVESVLNMWQPGRPTDIDWVHDDRAMAIWTDRHQVASAGGTGSGARDHPFDLRRAEVGEGLTWGGDNGAIVVARDPSASVFSPVPEAS